MSRLLIHADRGPPGLSRHLESPLLLLRSWYPGGPWDDSSEQLNLLIDDLQGHRLLAVENAGPLIELPLPAGTYQIAASRGSVRRSYTVKLEPGASFDLYLRLLPEIH